MLKKLIFPSIFGLFGLILLLSLGIWQVQRLAWKNSLVEEISNSISRPPITIIPYKIDSSSQYLAVRANGKFLKEELHVLHSLKPYGPGFKLIKPFKLKSNEIILIDLGFIAEKNKSKERIIRYDTIKGNVFFPNETDFFTPDPNFNRNIWFSRNLEAMASYLGTIPILIVLSTSVDETIITTPLNPNLTNNHLQYAMTWFSMAITWGLMSFYLLMRVIKKYKYSGGRDVL